MATNNIAANESAFDVQGLAVSFHLRMVSAVQALWHLDGSRPLVMLLTPPTTMSELPTDQDCANVSQLPSPRTRAGIIARPLHRPSMGARPQNVHVRSKEVRPNACSCLPLHTCRFHPAFTFPACWRLGTCTSCAAGARVRFSANGMDMNGTEARKSCIRIDALQYVRTGVECAASTLQKLASDAPRCRAGTLVQAPPPPILPNWRFFLDPIHLNPIGNAALACHVHASLQKECALHECRQGSLAARSSIAAAFCDVVRTHMHQNRSSLTSGQFRNVTFALFDAASNSTDSHLGQWRTTSGSRGVSDMAYGTQWDNSEKGFSFSKHTHTHH